MHLREENIKLEDKFSITIWASYSFFASHLLNPPFFTLFMKLGLDPVTICLCKSQQRKELLTLELEYFWVKLPEACRH